MGSKNLALSVESEKSQQEEILENNLDILSNIPESVTTHILSFLSTKDVVRTSVLSKCWEYQWTKITNLLFDDESYYLGDKNKKEKFMSFVDRVLLLLCNPVIESFTLRGNDYYDPSRVHAWISTAIRRNVQKLVIWCKVNELLVFPRCIYDNTSLIEMDLKMMCVFKLPTSVCFSRLKLLNLSRVTLLNGHYPQSLDLKLTFPELLEVKLHRCRWDLAPFIYINAPKLHSFTIADNECDYAHLDKIIDSDLWIDAPKLSKFKCDAYLAAHIMIPDSSSVVEATIELYCNFFQNEAMISGSACHLMSQLCGVKYLTLSRKTITAACHHNDFETLVVTFDHLLHLTITWGIPPLSVLAKLFIKMPRLLSLTFTTGNPFGLVENIPTCSSIPNLKIVKMLSYTGSVAELDLAKFVLMNATNLEELIIACNDFLYLDTQLLEVAVRQELQTVQWASRRVSLTLFDEYQAR